MCPNFPLSELRTKLDDMSDIMGIRPATAFEFSPVLPSTVDGVSGVVSSPEGVSIDLSSLCFLVPTLVAGAPFYPSVVLLADGIATFKVNQFRRSRFF